MDWEACVLMWDDKEAEWEDDKEDDKEVEWEDDKEA